jgi:alpha-1,4-galacturonosyltransferase
VFSDNVLGASVVVNSTIMNAHSPERLVFHVVTDAVNYGAMQTWFSINDFKDVVIEIKTVESFTWLNASYVPVLKQLQDAETQSYYFRSTGQNEGEVQKTALKFRNPKYLSMLNHLRFYIPEVYPELDKVRAISKSKQLLGSSCFMKVEQCYWKTAGMLDMLGCLTSNFMVRLCFLKNTEEFPL